MIEILQQYQALVGQDDLFGFWEKEFQLRQKAHNRSLTGKIQLSNQDECEFMYRSLYFTGRKHDFFHILFTNLHDLSILKWLNNRPSDILQEFLDFLAWNLSIRPVKPESLLFLVNLYRNERRELFIRVFNVLDLEQCRYLMVRTANSQFRQLLKQREKQIIDSDAFPYSLMEGIQSSPAHMTIHGDKGLLLQEAARKINLAARGHYTDPAGPERFNNMLEACDTVYQCGLIDDALLMLARLYRMYQEKNRLVDILEDRRIFKYFSQLARILVPLFSLLESSRGAFDRADSVWENNFGLLSRDEGSMYYLALYESVARGLKGHDQHILLEVLYKSRQILPYRVHDRGPLAEQDLVEGPAPGRIQEWLQLARERVISRPHESFTLLELVRLLNARNIISKDQLPASSLLEIYLDLWTWVPSSLFINEDLVEQLGPLVGTPLRRQVQRLLEAMGQYREGRLKDELLSRPGLFRQKDGGVQRAVLLGHVLGVLS